MKEDIKKVFFLGAGFSKAINKSYPVLANLLDEIKPKIGEREPSLKNYFSSGIPSEQKVNIETLLTYLSEDLPFKNDIQRSLDLTLYKDIVGLVSEKFYELSRENYWNSPETDHSIKEQIVSYLKREYKNVNFISLNYDLVLERIFWTVFNGTNIPSLINDASYDFPPPTLDQFYKYRMLAMKELEGNYNYRSPHPWPGIIKLHGSANWFWAGTTKADPIYYRNFSEDDGFIKRLSGGLVPYIVPPVLNKNSFYNHIALKYLWGEAHKLLENADEIYIVGFSFPQTDLAVRFLFQSALRKSSAQIYVINSASRDKLKENYEQAFGERKLHYDYTDSEDALQEFIKDKLEEISYRNEQF